jgi:hypothetical protein
MGLNLGHRLRMCEDRMLRIMVPVESEENHDNFHQDIRVFGQYSNLSAPEFEDGLDSDIC